MKTITQKEVYNLLSKNKDNETTCKSYEDLILCPNKGTLGCFMYDRAPPSDSFIVIDCIKDTKSNKDTKEEEDTDTPILKVIYPRMRKTEYIVSDDMKRSILISMKEFTIHIDTSKGLDNVYFRKGHLKFRAETGLWGSTPPFANIEYVCNQLEVIYDDSRTEAFCKKYKKQLEMTPQIQLGVDKTTDNFNSEYKHSDDCGCGEQGYSGCDCDRDMIYRYQSNFKLVPPNYEYKVYDLHRTKEWYVSYCTLSKDDLKGDRPMI